MTTNIFFTAATVVAIGALSMACSAESTESEQDAVETSSDALSAGCFSRSAAPVGSPEWRAAFESCLAEAQAAGGGAAPSGGQSCSVSTQCINGACTCGSGPSRGASCDGRSTTGAESCSVKCRSCT